MGRLTECDGQGNWCIKGLPWKDTYKGQVITDNTCKKIYGAFCKLKAYEDIELTPEEVEEISEKNRKQKMRKSNPNVYCCPECGEELNPMWNYCPWCVQHVED